MDDDDDDDDNAKLAANNWYRNLGAQTLESLVSNEDRGYWVMLSKNRLQSLICTLDNRSISSDHRIHRSLASDEVQKLWIMDTGILGFEQ
jgi:hypothetical protein